MTGFPALYATSSVVHVLTAGGEMLAVPLAQAAAKLADQPVIVCHAPTTLQKMGRTPSRVLDVLELFAFVKPGVFLVPSPVGLAQALSIPEPDDVCDYPGVIAQAADLLLADLSKIPADQKQDLADLASLMGLGGKGWGWSAAVIAALGVEPSTDQRTPRALWEKFLKRLPEMADTPAEAPSSFNAPDENEVLARLNLMLHTRAGQEERPDQARYARAVSAAFAAKNNAAAPNIVLAEAGTGTGKTLGYLAPATVWAEKNDGVVWVSTYTKNLQKQLDQELSRLPISPDDRDRYAVTRKGRENYLCLLNFAEFAAGAPFRPNPQGVVAAGLMLRWLMNTRDGDFTGVDYPGWLTGLMGAGHTTMLADRRGECIHGACEFYNRCFIERSVRKAKRARIVIANHALVMNPAVRDDDRPPAYYVFDEGHHLLDAADSAFDITLGVREGYELRRWALGPEGGQKGRARGLKKRLDDLLDDEGRKILSDVTQAAKTLPSDRAFERLREGIPAGSFEQALALVMQQVTARGGEDERGYSLESPVHPLLPGLPEKIGILKTDLARLRDPLQKLAAHLSKMLKKQAGDLATDQRLRIQRTINGLEARTVNIIGAWIALCDDLILKKDNPDFIDWMEVTRVDGKILDVGILRRWRNPLKPFADVMKADLQGAVITSATLRDRAADQGWDYARAATGADLFSTSVTRESFVSPFDYAARTRVLVITDVDKARADDVAGALQALFTASHGGALALFTAINRLRTIHGRIAKGVEDAGLHLYAQHVDKMDNGTLVDLFRADRHACLLGTDAMRDGVDVPGDSLRLLIYDRVPWPQPRLLHKARREEFGGRAYDEQLTRLRLKQAYGRLVRRADDRGVFVMLDSALPTRLCDAFPEGVVVERVGIKDAVAAVRDFFSDENAAQMIRAA